MNQKELTYLFNSTRTLPGRLLIVAPQEFRRLVGRRITDSHIFLLVCRGSLTLSVNGKEHEMRACSFLDVLDWVECCIHTVTDNLGAWCVIPSFEFTRESLNSLKPFSDDYLLDRIYAPALTVSETECGILERQIRLLYSSVTDLTHRYRNELAQTYFKSMMLELGNITQKYCRMEENRTASAISRRDTIMMDFMRLVRKYVVEEHGVDYYAGRLYVSPKHLSRVIREVMDKTPHEIICNELIQKALELLKDNKTPVQEISAALNFSDQAAFCKFFKKHVGMAPSEYRKRQN